MLAHGSLSRIFSRWFAPSKSTFPFDGTGTNSGHVSFSYLLHLFRLAGSPKSLRIPLIEWENGMRGLQPLPSPPSIFPPWQLGIKFPIFHLPTRLWTLLLPDQTWPWIHMERPEKTRRQDLSAFFSFFFHIRSLPCRVSCTARSLRFRTSNDTFFFCVWSAVDLYLRINFA